MRRGRHGLHHTDDARRGRSPSVACAFALLAGLVACDDPVAARYATHTGAARVAFGDDQRVTAAIAPGRATSPDGEAELVAHASAPWPSLRVANGTVDEQVITLTLDNVSPTAALTARQGPLQLSGRRDVRCGDATYTEQPGVTVLPPELSGQGAGTGRSGELRLPPCTELTLGWQPASTASAIRLGVIGDAGSDVTDLRAAVDAATALGVDAVVVLGGVVKAGGDPAPAQDVLDASGLPYVVAIGAADASRGSGRFLRAFGQPDWYVEVGNAGWWLLDTADGALADAQFRFVAETEGMSPGVLVTTVPPFGAGASSGFRSRQQGARLANLLAERGVEQLVTGIDAGPGSLEWGSFALASLRPVADERVLLEVTIEEPWSETPRVSVARVAW